MFSRNIIVGLAERITNSREKHVIVVDSWKSNCAIDCTIADFENVLRLVIVEIDLNEIVVIVIAVEITVGKGVVIDIVGITDVGLIAIAAVECKIVGTAVLVIVIFVASAVGNMISLHENNKEIPIGH